jgi:hypothetical protein
MMASMHHPKELKRYRIGPLTERFWRAGGPNSVVTAWFARVRVPSFCLAEGDEYEVEGALAASHGQARALAVVQDLERVKKQYGPPVNQLLYERRQPKLTCLEPQGVEALWADEADLGGRRPISLGEAAEARRRLIRGIRADGWTGAIVLPGFSPETKMVLAPRRYLRGALKVHWRGPLAGAVPPALVDFSLGSRPDFPTSLETGALPLELPRQRPITTSWRPPPLIPDPF